MGQLLTWLKYLDRAIRGNTTHSTLLREGEIDLPVGGLTIVGVLLGMLYGICMGCFALFQKGGASAPQVAAAMIKVPVLFFLTLAVTYPSLYVFNALVGSRLSALSVLRMLVISLTVMLTVLASLGPIIAFFSASTTSYPFMLLLNVVVFAVSGFLGLRYLLLTLHRLSLAGQPQTATPVPPLMPEAGDPDSMPGPYVPALPQNFVGSGVDRPISTEVRRVFRVWMGVFGLVGAQMAWVLRPFLGSPNHPFSWFRGRESNFFEAVLSALRHLM